MKRPDNIKIWPYNLICAAVGITGKESGDPWAAFTDDVDAAISKSFKEVMYTHTSMKKRTVGSILSAIEGHYRDGLQIRPMLKEMHIAPKMYYEVLHDVYTQLRTYIYITGKVTDQESVVAIRSVVAEPAAHDTVNFDVWPFNVFDKIGTRTVVDRLMDLNPEKVEDGLLEVIWNIYDGLNSKKPGSGDTAYNAWLSYHRYGESVATIAKNTGHSSSKVSKDIRKINDVLTTVINIAYILFRDMKFQLNDQSLKWLGYICIDSIEDLASRDFGQLNLTMNDTMIVNIARYLLTQNLREKQLIITTFTSNRDNKKELLRNFNVKKSNAECGLNCYTVGEARAKIGLTAPMFAYLAGKKKEDIVNIYIDYTCSGMIFEIKENTNKQTTAFFVYNPHTGETNRCKNKSAAEDILYAIERTESTKEVLKNSPQRTVTITIPEGATPAYYIPNIGYILIQQ